MTIINREPNEQEIEEIAEFERLAELRANATVEELTAEYTALCVEAQAAWDQVCYLSDHDQDAVINLYAPELARLADEIKAK